MFWGGGAATSAAASCAGADAGAPWSGPQRVLARAFLAPASPLFASCATMSSVTAAHKEHRQYWARRQLGKPSCYQPGTPGAPQEPALLLVRMGGWCRRPGPIVSSWACAFPSLLRCSAHLPLQAQCPQGLGHLRSQLGSVQLITASTLHHRQDPTLSSHAFGVKTPQPLQDFPVPCRHPC